MAERETEITIKLNDQVSQSAERIKRSFDEIGATAKKLGSSADLAKSMGVDSAQVARLEEVIKQWSGAQTPGAVGRLTQAIIKSGAFKDANALSAQLQYFGKVTGSQANKLAQDILGTAQEAEKATAEVAKAGHGMQRLFGAFNKYIDAFRVGMLTHRLTALPHQLAADELVAREIGATFARTMPRGIGTYAAAYGGMLMKAPPRIGVPAIGGLLAGLAAYEGIKWAATREEQFQLDVYRLRRGIGIGDEAALGRYRPITQGLIRSGIPQSDALALQERGLRIGLTPEAGAAFAETVQQLALTGRFKGPMSAVGEQFAIVVKAFNQTKPEQFKSLANALTAISSATGAAEERLLKFTENLSLFGRVERVSPQTLALFRGFGEKIDLSDEQSARGMMSAYRLLSNIDLTSDRGQYVLNAIGMGPPHQVLARYKNADDAGRLQMVLELMQKFDAARQRGLDETRMARYLGLPEEFIIMARHWRELPILQKQLIDKAREGQAAWSKVQNEFAQKWALVKGAFQGSIGDLTVIQKLGERVFDGMIVGARVLGGGLGAVASALNDILDKLEKIGALPIVNYFFTGGRDEKKERESGTPSRGGFIGLGALAGGVLAPFTGGVSVLAGTLLGAAVGAAVDEVRTLFEGKYRGAKPDTQEAPAPGAPESRRDRWPGLRDGVSKRIDEIKRQRQQQAPDASGKSSGILGRIFGYLSDSIIGTANAKESQLSQDELRRMLTEGTSEGVVRGLREWQSFNGDVIGRETVGPGGAPHFTTDSVRSALGIGGISASGVVPPTGGMMPVPGPGTGAGAAPPMGRFAALSARGATARQQAMNYFMGQGWSKEQAAGLVANLEAESKLNPNDVGDSGRARGIAQWHPDRRRAIEQHFGKRVEDMTFAEQLQAVQWELTQGPEKAAGNALRGAQTAAEAGAIASRRYERPRRREYEASSRASLAEQIARSHSADGAAPGGAAPPHRESALTPAAQPFGPSGVTGSVMPGAGPQGYNYFQKRGVAPLARGELETIQTPYGKIAVHPQAASDFQGFYNDLAAAGAPLKHPGSYNMRRKRWGGGWSSHAYGTANDLDDQQFLSPQMRAWIAADPQRWERIKNKWNMGQPLPQKDPAHIEWRGPKPVAGGKPSADTEADNRPHPFLGRGIIPAKPAEPAKPVTPAKPPQSNHIYGGHDIDIHVNGSGDPRAVADRVAERLYAATTIRPESWMGDGYGSGMGSLG